MIINFFLQRWTHSWRRPDPSHRWTTPWFEHLAPAGYQHPPEGPRPGGVGGSPQRCGGYRRIPSYPSFSRWPLSLRCQRHFQSWIRHGGEYPKKNQIEYNLLYIDIKLINFLLNHYILILIIIFTSPVSLSLMLNLFEWSDLLHKENKCLLGTIHTDQQAMCLCNMYNMCLKD